MPFELNRAAVGDCFQLMSELPDGCVDLCFADPPFNIGYEYDLYDDKRSSGDFIQWCGEWIGQVRRVLKEDGSFWVAMGDEYVSELDVKAKSLGFFKRSHVIWFYTFGVNCVNNFTRSHTHLVYYTKSKDTFTFNAKDPSCRVPSARQLVYNDKRANPKGRLPDNTWILRPQDIESCFTGSEDVWHQARVAGTFKERQGFHGCQMPLPVMERIVRSCSREGEVILDPFCGSGTTAAAAYRLGRKFYTCDISEDYVRGSNDRIEREANGATGRAEEVE